MKNLMIIVSAIFLLMLTGCKKELLMTTTHMAPVSEEVSEKGKTQEVDYLLEPYECVGLKLTPAIGEGEITVLRGIMPDVLFGEYYPGRVRWNGIVAQKDGKEFFAQALFSPPDWSGNFLWTLVIDGKPDKTAKLMVISTLVEFAYDVYGKEFSIKDRDDFLENEISRKEFILKNGTPLGEMEILNESRFYEQVLFHWNSFKTEKGRILSPLGLDEIKDIAAINPQYSFGQKLIADGHFSLCLDYIATAVGVGIDVFRAANGAVPSAGWDYNSEFPNRRNMGLIFEYISQMRKRLISDINRNNALVGQRR